MGILDGFNPYGIDPYGAGMLGGNDLSSLLQAYGGYRQPEINIPGIEPQFSASGLMPNEPRGEAKDTVNPIARLWAALNERPTSPGFLGEPSAAPPNGAWMRPPMGPPPSSGAEPSEVWGGPQPVPQSPPNIPQSVAQPPPGLFTGDGSQSSMGGGQGGGVFMPPNATPTQGTQLAQPPDQGGTNPLGRLGAAGAGFFNARSPMEAIGNLIGGAITGQRQDKAGQATANQAQMAKALFGALQQRGIPAEQAWAIASATSTDSKLAEHLLPEALGLKPPSTVEGVIASRMYRGGQPGQPGQPGGQPGQSPYDEIAKLKEAEARGTKAGGYIGETQATAEMNLPSAIAQAKEALRLAGELRTHPGRDNGLFWHGKASAYLPDSAIPGNTDARDANSILQQLKGGAFLEAYKTLKGGGSITEVEGKKATDALARMDRAQSRPEFDRALSDYEGVIRLGIDRANQQASQPAPYGFKGNTEWQTVSPGVRIRQKAN